MIIGSERSQSISRTKYIFTFFIVCLLSNSGFAQFTVDAQLRNRFELRNGYRKLAAEGTTPAAVISQRTRLSFSFENEHLKLKITPQDVRIWGDEQLSSSTGVYGDEASLDLFEGYVQIKTGAKGWLSVGRQQLVYDNQRILSARNWNQNGIAYDALIYKWQSDDWDIHAGTTWNTAGNNTADNFYDPTRIKTLNFVWAKHRFSESWNLSVSHIASGVTQTETDNKLFFKQTIGLYTTFTKDRLNVMGNLYYQFGKNNSAKKVSAWMANFDLKYQSGKITPGIGLSYLSGNKNTNEKNDHLFDVLYGSRHRFYGSMDYFSNFSKDTKQGGLVYYYFYFDVKITAKTSLKNMGQYFTLAQVNETTPSDKKLGYDNDLVLKHKFSDWGALECGYSFFLPTRSLKTLQEVVDPGFAQFLYLQLTFVPTLFKN
ncbi:alginate export family protein [uncultured Draconibacterium sp.]|uniref:alginate export family protein n=1 Tax=uncultured Draconibacterium sp. TaxID=1573823 RepID=UPI0025FB6EC2|nr:alginate export family protein [uncultured Draconibacterium sp.]